MIAGKVVNNAGVLKHFSQKTKFAIFSFQRVPILQPVFHHNSFRLMFRHIFDNQWFELVIFIRTWIFADVAVLKHFSKKFKL